MTKDTATTLEDKRIRVMSPSGNIVLLPEREANDKSDPTSTMLASNNDENDDMDHHGKIRSGLMQRHVSLEYLNPVYECGTRKSAMAVAIINLVATTCGGGVLSLPLAFRRAGILPTTALMIYGVLATDFSLYILVSCARRTGGRSYGDVAKSSFGNLAEVLTSTLLGCMLIGSLTAYLVLVKDIWTPVVLSLLPMSVKQPLLLHHDTSTTTIRDDDMFDPTLRASKEGSSFILFLILILGSPLLLKRDLHALRHTCYVGFFSCALLMVAVVYRAYEAVRSNDPRRAPLNWYSTDIADYAFAFPIVVLCFFCSYNVLGVHASLLDPTRNRVKCVLDTSMFICVL
jgi:sodium-coupled neutral amino acid transporter 11